LFTFTFITAELFGRGHYLLLAVSSVVNASECPSCDYTVDYTANSSWLSGDLSLHSTTTNSSLFTDSTACNSTLPDSPVYELRHVHESYFNCEPLQQ